MRRLSTPHDIPVVITVPSTYYQLPRDIPVAFAGSNHSLFAQPVHDSEACFSSPFMK